MRCRHGTITPKQQSRRVANHREASSAVGRNNNGRANKHPLTPALNDAMHDDQHHRGGSQVIEIRGDDEGGEGNSPEQTLGVARTDPLRDEIEAAVVVQDLDDAHRSQQEHHDTRGSPHIIEEHIVADEILHSIARRILTIKELLIFSSMFSHHEVGSPADVYHPSHRSDEHRYGRLVDTRQVTGGNQHVAEYQHQYYYKCHISLKTLN